MQYTIIVIGDSGCGKTNFISRMCTGKYTKRHTPTIGSPCILIHERTNYGDITFTTYENYPDYDLHVDGAICMIDLQSATGLSNVMRNIEMLEHKHPGIPIVLCGNKCDAKERKVPWKSIRGLIPKNFRHPYYDVSARSNYHLSRPWLDLAKIVSGHRDLEYEEFYPGLVPPEVVMEGGKLRVR
jgi:GTPase SAR1 family protein